MADPFTILVTNLNSLGFYGFLLPFIFVFTVTYALLMRSKLIEDQKIMGVLSLVLAFFAIGFGGPALANFFVNLFGYAAVVIAGILVIVMFVAMSGGDVSKILGNSKATALTVVAVGIIIFFVALGALGVNITGETVGIIFVVVLLAAAIMFITGQS